MEVEIFTHKNCTECNLLIEYLESRGLLGKVKLVDTELYPFLALERGVISTPSVFVDGKLVYAGKVDLYELEEILNGNQVSREFNREELIKKFMEGVVDSFAATAWLYVNRDFDSFMSQRDFVLAVTGLALSDKVDEGYQFLRDVLVKDGEKVLNEWEPMMLKNISSNFVREIYWLYERKLPKESLFSKYPLEVFAHWLMVRGGAVGRVGLRIHPLSSVQTMTRIAKVYSYLQENYDSIWDRVEKEQRKLKEMRAVQ
ncbi:MAG: thioredoxin family protein [Metallosphaera sp.]|uniref:Thioredoxin/glutaredoxin-like protein n=1 Tax=Metallosphaera cuprina (strain Ar-4) TaxID=1006006 RepID=F4FZU6_METCR|nr:thioredoxin family protein [Metallosphaera cuprina]AEB94525.1 thioredoxin/glutaredoxin-like protein [Metallosphaera cuprina Ar-4]